MKIHAHDTELVPAGHRRQILAPSRLNWFASQAVQLAAPVPENVFATQFVQTLLLGDENVPLVQSTHDVLFVSSALRCPAAQLRQLDAAPVA